MNFLRSLRPSSFFGEDDPEPSASEAPPKDAPPAAAAPLKPIGEDPYSAVSTSSGFSKFKTINTERNDAPSALSRFASLVTLKKSTEKTEASAAAATKERTREVERLKAFKREGEDLLVSRYLTLLSRRTLDLNELRREVAENFVPDSVRDLIWKLLCGYMPADAASRDGFIKQAREAYVSTRDKFYAETPMAEHLPDPKGDRNLLSQIRVDIPRTNPIDGITYFKHVNWLFGQTHVQEAMEHVCFVWAKQHPATGYFQGFSDLVVPFFVVFSVTFASPDGLMALSSGRARRADVLSQLDWDSLEADTYWCLSRMLRSLPPEHPHADPSPLPSKDASKSASHAAPATPAALPTPPAPPTRTRGFTSSGLVDDEHASDDEAAIQAAYSEAWDAMHSGLALRCLWGVPGLAQVRGALPTASHAGIHAIVKNVRDVVAFYDPKLFKHLEQHRVDFMFFCMRWVICLMTRELPLCALLQLWDQYLASDNLYLTHIYVCAAMLITFRGQLLELGFGEMLMLLQSLPSQLWDAEENQLFDPSYHLKKVFKLAGIIYQEHVRSKDAFIASYLIMAAALRGYMSLAAYVQASTLLFVVQRLEASAARAILVIENEDDEEDDDAP